MSSVFSRKITMSTFSGCFTGRRHALEPAHGAQAHVEVEDLAQRDVERPDAAADRRGERALDPDEVLAEDVDRLLGSQSPVALNAFSPASTSFHSIVLPCLEAAASSTSCAAGQMSTPVPSPSMNGMIGLSETWSAPSAPIVILSAMSPKLPEAVGRAVTVRSVRRLLVPLLLLTTAACSSASSPRTARVTTTTRAVTAPTLLALHATTGAHPGVFDSRGRQVLLRGVDVNSLGDYYQDDPSLPTVVPVTDHDWASMASQGFDVVRLLVSWSKLEPQRGVYDDAYLTRVIDTVHAGAHHGIYSVIDMHQDAWAKYIASPKGAHCTNGGTPAIGWDGAPQWATLTNGSDTWRDGSRDVRGGRDRMGQLLCRPRRHHDRVGQHMGARRVRVGADPAVAGFDLLNEPNHGHDTNTALPALGRFYERAIGAIRAAEARAGFHHIVFFEDTVFGAFVPAGFTHDTNIVFAPHNYGESIGSIPIEAEFDYFAAKARAYRAAMWIGEYGWFSDPTVNESKVARFAAKADTLVGSGVDAGEAWWQWRQACGDPHSIGHPGGSPPKVLIHFQANECPGDHDLGVIPQWHCTGRPYPRATPGRLTSLHTDCTSELDLTGTTAQPGTIDIWFPNARFLHTHGLTDADTEAVQGGLRITGTVKGTYQVQLKA